MVFLSNTAFAGKNSAAAENALQLIQEGRKFEKVANYVKSAEYYRIAAEQGNMVAENNLGILYYRGKGVSKDYGTGLYWLKKSEAHGSANAAYSIGRIYEYGLGVAKNIDTAKLWYNKATAKGNTRAKKELERLQYIPSVEEKSTGYTGGYYNGDESKLETLAGERKVKEENSSLTRSRTGASVTLPYHVDGSYVSYTVTLYPNYSNSGSGGAETVTLFTGGTESVSLANRFTSAGYQIGKWTTKQDGSGTEYAADATLNLSDLTGSVTLYARWKAGTYTVTLNPQGGTISSGNVTGYTYGAGATLPTNVTRTNYTFDGWYTGANGTGTKVTAISASEYGNKTYYAKWTPVTYTVKFDPNGGNFIGSTAVKSETYSYGETAVLPTPVKDSMVFTGWYTAATNGTRVTAITIANKDQTYYAHWETAVVQVREVYYDNSWHTIDRTYTGFNEAINDLNSTYSDIGKNGTNEHWVQITIKLLDDIVLDGSSQTYELFANSSLKYRYITVDLNGHGILKRSTDHGFAEVRQLENLTIMDSDPSTVHYITLDNNGKGTDVSSTEPTDESKYVKVTGGYLTGYTSCIGVNGGALSLCGGTITGNEFAVQTYNGSSSVLVVSGSPVVAENSVGNVLLSEGLKIKIGKITSGDWFDLGNSVTLSSSARIGVTLGSNYGLGKFTENLSGKGNVYSFFSDVPNSYNVIPSNINGDPNNSEAEMADWVYVVAFDSQGGTEKENQIIYPNVSEKKVIKPEPDPTRTGYVFGGWYKEAECTTAYDFNTEVTGNLTLYAKWIDLASCAASVTTGTAPNETTTYYESITEAITAWQNADGAASLTLINDTEISATIDVTGTNGRVLDLNGKTLSYTGGDGKAILVRNDTASFTLKDSDACGAIHGYDDHAGSRGAPLAAQR